MEDDIFDDVAGHEGLVQEAVDADQLLTLLVGTKAYGTALALWGPATPGNVCLHTIDEVVLIEVIMIKSLRDQNNAPVVAANQDVAAVA